MTDRVALQDVPTMTPAVDRSGTGEVVVLGEDRGVPA